MGFESPDFYVFYFNLKWFEPFHLRFFMVCQSPKTLSCQGFQSIKQPHQIRKSHRLVRIGWGHSFWSCWPDSNWWPHPYQPIFDNFYNNFSLFLAVFVLNGVVSKTFEKCSLRCFHACLWWKCGQPEICSSTNLIGTVQRRIVLFPWESIWSSRCWYHNSIPTSLPKQA